MSVTKKSRAGMTFLELIISMSFFLLFFILCASLFLSSWRGYHVITVTQDVERNAFLAIERFSRDLSETGMSSICNYTEEGGKGFIFFPSRRDILDNFVDYGSESPGIWQTWILYYLFPDQKNNDLNGTNLNYLMRKVIPKSEQPTISDIYKHIASMDGAQVAARDIYAFTAAPQTMGEINNWHILVETRDAYRGEKCSFSLEKVIIVNLP